MFLASLQAAPACTQAWVGPVLAISAAVVALVAIIIFAGLALGARALHRAVERMADNLSELRVDLHAVLEGAKRVTDEGAVLVDQVREEGAAYVATSKRFRRRLDHTVDRMTERMADLDALVDVVHEEVEDTAMQFATALRTARLSTSILGKVLRRRRRR